MPESGFELRYSDHSLTQWIIIVPPYLYLDRASQKCPYLKDISKNQLCHTQLQWLPVRYWECCPDIHTALPWGELHKNVLGSCQVIQFVVQIHQDCGFNPQLQLIKPPMNAYISGTTNGCFSFSLESINTIKKKCLQSLINQEKLCCSGPTICLYLKVTMRLTPWNWPCLLLYCDSWEA